MMIILVSGLLAVALAAPVDVQETARWPRPLAHIRGAVGNMNYIGASNGALVEYFEIYREPEIEEMYHKLLEWGKKWNIEFTKNYRYDAKTNRIWSVVPDVDARDSNGNLITKQVFPPKAKTFTEEEYNASALRNQALIVHLLVREGLPKEAIDQYFAGGFHLRPVDYNKIRNMTKWCNRYLHGFHEKLEALMVFTDTVVTGAEEQPPVVETTTATVETTTVA